MELKLVEEDPQGAYSFLENRHNSFKSFEILSAAIP